MTDDPTGLPTPDAAFAQHFTDPVYDSRGDDLAPFGSDEGSDLLASWAGRRDELASSATLATVLGCAPSDVATYVGPMEGVDGIETASFISSAAFVVLRLTGRLDEEDRRLALEALEFQLRILSEMNSFPEPPQALLTQRDDLLSWRNPA